MPETIDINDESLEWKREDLDNKDSFTYFVNNTEWYNLPKSPEYYFKRLKNKKLMKADNIYKGWTFLTIAPSKLQTGGLGMKDEKSLEQFCHRWFAKYNFSEYFWVIEYGKDEENPFLHVHALTKGIVNKKFRKEGQYKFLKEEWNKLLPCKITNINSWMEKKANPQIDADVLHQRINDKSLWELKYNYLHNDLKGTHQNFSGGTRGVISSN